MQDSSLAVLYILVALVCISGNGENMKSRRIQGIFYVTPVKKHPKFMAQLEAVLPDNLKGNYSGHFCAGTIIHWSWIITAAHCVLLIFPKPKNETQKRNGEKELTPIDFHIDFLTIKVGSQYAGFGKEVSPLSIEIHPHYEFIVRFRNDIALIETVPMLFTPDNSPTPIGAVEITTKKIDPENENQVLRVYGWGGKLFTTYSYVNSVLDYLDVNIYPWSLCHRYSGFYLMITEICTLQRPAETGPCYGDSGGPLMMDGKQIGIVSHAARSLKTCGTQPEIYTNLAYFNIWIQDLIGFNLTKWRNKTNNGNNYTWCGPKCNHYFTRVDLEVEKNISRTGVYYKV